MDAERGKPVGLPEQLCFLHGKAGRKARRQASRYRKTEHAKAAR